MGARAPRLKDADGLWEYALKSLAGRAYSTGELRAKLRQHAARATDADLTIARLKECGYLNDRRFAESFAAARLDNQGFGQTRVLADLSRRRVAPAVAQQTVGKLYAQVDEQVLAEDFLRRKLRMASRESLLETEKDIAAAYRKLRRAGFRPSTAIAAIQRFSQNPELLDGFEPPAESGEEEEE
jgi:regulatory protein